MRFQDIPQFTRSAGYRVDVPWDHLEHTLKSYDDRSAPGWLGLDLDPDFQRAHVWDDDKRRRYVEFILRGGQSARDVFFNHPGWSGSFQGQMVLVDGKQRLEAVRRFLRSELSVFGGHLFRDFTDKLRMTSARFTIHVNDLGTRREVLQWYVDLNDGGVAHTEAEITKVRALLEKESV